MYRKKILERGTCFFFSFLSIRISLMVLFSCIQMNLDMRTAGCALHHNPICGTLTFPVQLNHLRCNPGPLLPFVYPPVLPNDGRLMMEISPPFIFAPQPQPPANFHPATTVTPPSSTIGRLGEEVKMKIK